MIFRKIRPKNNWWETKLKFHDQKTDSREVFEIFERKIMPDKVLLLQSVLGYSNFWQALRKIPTKEIPKITNDKNYWKKYATPKNSKS